ncbi:MAG: GTP-binding protein [Cyanobium sp. CACIAM 14]|nr:MAG: GTP-binding protein [Cyanobium sp. CACIAM 14]
MRQGVLAGRTAGLRPAERRRLERLCHRRHPVDAVADLLTLQRLATEGRALQLPLTLVVDGRGLCRLLWVGALDQAARLLEKLPGPARRQGSDLRLITCSGTGRQPHLQPSPQEGVVGMDLAPELWLRFGQQADAGGHWPAALHTPASSGGSAWHCSLQGDLADLCAREPAAVVDRPAAPETTAAAPDGPERVLLLVQTSGERTLDDRRIAELEGLVRSAGAVPVGRIEQRRHGPAGQSPWGEGKLGEAALESRRLGASQVVADRELTPAQARDLERLLDLPVSDRSELILDIFAQRAASGAGRLQVELAQLRYRLPRLTGRGLTLSRQGGGIGTRGPGETQLEKDRRAIARRIERLQREVRRLGDHRARLRQGRRSLPRLALVGYTNAGKSSLLNALTGARGSTAVLAENQLFATLDPTTRRIDSGDQSLLVTDTVGFIRDLPPQLMEAFRSTFEEALDADGLLIVVDLADPAWPEQLATVNAILDSLEATIPRRVVGNQIDRCPAGELERARALEPAMLFVSATAGLGLQHLRRELQDWPPITPPVTAPVTAPEMKPEPHRRPAPVRASGGAN